MVGYMTEMVLEGRPVLCIGGGKVALRKVTGLLLSGPEITIIAPTLHPQLEKLVQRGRVQHQADSFSPAHLDSLPRPVLVFAATSEACLNQEIARQATQRGLLCNSSDDVASSTFLVPAVVRRGPITVGVATAGCSPALARLLKERLTLWLEPGWGEIALLFGAVRERVKQTFPNPLVRHTFWRDTCLAVARERRFERQENNHWLAERIADEADKKASTTMAPN